MGTEFKVEPTEQGGIPTYTYETDQDNTYSGAFRTIDDVYSALNDPTPEQAEAFKNTNLLYRMENGKTLRWDAKEGMAEYTKVVPAAPISNYDQAMNALDETVAPDSDLNQRNNSMKDLIRFVSPNAAPINTFGQDAFRYATSEDREAGDSHFGRHYLPQVHGSALAAHAANTDLFSLLGMEDMPGSLRDAANTAFTYRMQQSDGSLSSSYELKSRGDHLWYRNKEEGADNSWYGMGIKVPNIAQRAQDFATQFGYELGAEVVSGVATVGTFKIGAALRTGLDKLYRAVRSSDIFGIGKDVGPTNRPRPPGLTIAKSATETAAMGLAEGIAYYAYMSSNLEQYTNGDYGDVSKADVNDFLTSHAISNGTDAAGAALILAGVGRLWGKRGLVARADRLMRHSSDDELEMYLKTAKELGDTDLTLAQTIIMATSDSPGGPLSGTSGLTLQSIQQAMNSMLSAHRKTVTSKAWRGKQALVRSLNKDLREYLGSKYDDSDLGGYIDGVANIEELTILQETYKKNGAYYVQVTATALQDLKVLQAQTITDALRINPDVTPFGVAVAHAKSLLKSFDDVKSLKKGAYGDLEAKYAKPDDIVSAELLEGPGPEDLLARLTQGRASHNSAVGRTQFVDEAGEVSFAALTYQQINRAIRSVNKGKRNLKPGDEQGILDADNYKAALEELRDDIIARANPTDPAAVATHAKQREALDDVYYNLTLLNFNTVVGQLAENAKSLKSIRHLPPGANDGNPLLSSQMGASAASLAKGDAEVYAVSLEQAGNTALDILKRAEESDVLGDILAGVGPLAAKARASIEDARSTLKDVVDMRLRDVIHTASNKANAPDGSGKLDVDKIIDDFVTANPELSRVAYGDGARAAMKRTNQSVVSTRAALRQYDDLIDEAGINKDLADSLKDGSEERIAEMLTSPNLADGAVEIHKILKKFDEIDVKTGGVLKLRGRAQRAIAKGIIDRVTKDYTPKAGEEVIDASALAKFFRPGVHNDMWVSVFGEGSDTAVAKLIRMMQNVNATDVAKQLDEIDPSAPLGKVPDDMYFIRVLTGAINRRGLAVTAVLKHNKYRWSVSMREVMSHPEQAIELAKLARNWYTLAPFARRQALVDVTSEPFVDSISSDNTKWSILMATGEDAINMTTDAANATVNYLFK